MKSMQWVSFVLKCKKCSGQLALTRGISNKYLMEISLRFFVFICVFGFFLQSYAAGLIWTNLCWEEPLISLLKAKLIQPSHARPHTHIAER